MLSTKIKILLADDDEDDCMLFKEVIDETQLQVKVELVHDGIKLMELLNKAVEEDLELPNALFLDLNMPLKNGYCCLEEIKTDMRLRHLPVIIYSTSMISSNVNKLFEIGAHYYICKPVDFDKLKKAIIHAISLILNNPASQPSRDGFLLSDSKSLLF